MQFSIWPMQRRTPAEVLDLARAADDAEWLGIWYADHYMPSTGTSERASGDIHEAWSMLAAIAATTSRLRVGPLVSPTTVHHPALLAKRAATIERIASGRFVLGLGAGWQVNEHDAYGIDLMPPGRRVDRHPRAHSTDVAHDERPRRRMSIAAVVSAGRRAASPGLEAYGVSSTRRRRSRHDLRRRRRH